MIDFEFINHGVNHVSDFASYPNRKEGYEHCRNGAGLTLIEAVMNALYYLAENSGYRHEVLTKAFLAKYGPIEDTGEVENQANHFFYVTFFYN